MGKDTTFADTLFMAKNSYEYAKNIMVEIVREELRDVEDTFKKHAFYGVDFDALDKSIMIYGGIVTFEPTDSLKKRLKDLGFKILRISKRDHAVYSVIL